MRPACFGGESLRFGHRSAPFGTPHRGRDQAQRRRRQLGHQAPEERDGEGLQDLRAGAVTEEGGGDARRAATRRLPRSTASVPSPGGHRAARGTDACAGRWPARDRHRGRGRQARPPSRREGDRPQRTGPAAGPPSRRRRRRGARAPPRHRPAGQAGAEPVRRAPRAGGGLEEEEDAHQDGQGDDGEPAARRPRGPAAALSTCRCVSAGIGTPLAAVARTSATTGSRPAAVMSATTSTLRITWSWTIAPARRRADLGDVTEPDLGPARGVDLHVAEAERFARIVGVPRTTTSKTLACS